MIGVETLEANPGPRNPNDDPSDAPAEENIEGRPLPPPDEGTERTVPEEDDPAIEETEQQPT